MLGLSWTLRGSDYEVDRAVDNTQNDVHSDGKIGANLVASEKRIAADPNAKQRPSHQLPRSRPVFFVTVSVRGARWTVSIRKLARC